MIKYHILHNRITNKEYLCFRPLKRLLGETLKCGLTAIPIKVERDSWICITVAKGKLILWVYNDYLMLELKNEKP